MSVTVRIPTPLRKLTKEADVVSGDGGTLASCIESLERQYPGLKERLCDEVGGLRRCVDGSVDGGDLRLLAGTATGPPRWRTCSPPPRWRHAFRPRGGARLTSRGWAADPRPPPLRSGRSCR